MIAASPARRVGALALDGVILAAGFFLTVSVGVAVDAPGFVGWLAVGWLFVVAPLYFALYHGRSTARTPGEREAGVALRDAGTGSPIGVKRALLHAYGGVGAVVLAVPLVADALSFLRSGTTAWHDRLLGTTVILVPGDVSQPRRPDTDLAFSEEFEPGTEGHYFRRARALVRRRPRELAAPVVLLFVVMVGLTGLYGALLVADVADSGDLPDAGTYWASTAMIAVSTGVFWSQATVSLAADALRTGASTTLPALFHRAATRANAVTAFAAVIVGVPVLVVSFAPALAFLLLGLVLIGRLAFVVPVVLLDDTPLLTAMRRSWTLTTGATWRLLGYLAASVVFLDFAIGICMALGLTVSAAIASTSAFSLIVGGMIGLLVASIPLGAAVATVGTAWYLVYDQGRREHDAAAD